MTPPVPIHDYDGLIVAKPLDYEEMLAAIGGRIDALNTPYYVLEDVMGLARGHLGKIMGAAQSKRMGLDVLLRVIEGLGYRLAFVEHLDIAATIDEMGNHFRARVDRGEGRGRLRKKLSPAIIRAAAAHYGAMGRGKPKTFGISKRRLRAKQRRAARARWGKPKTRIAKPSADYANPIHPATRAGCRDAGTSAGGAPRAPGPAHPPRSAGHGAS